MTTHVFITIDTEVSMGGAWDHPDVGPLDIDTCIYCKRPDRTEHGVRSIMDIFDAHALPVVFFVDSAAHELCDTQQFTDLCQEITGRGHDVQLHLHPGARAYARLQAAGPVIDRPAGTSDMLHAYDEDQQHALLAEGCDILAHVTGNRPRAFRAGNYAVDETSMSALARAGIAVDFSYNRAFQGSMCKLTGTTNTPYRLGQVVEIPVTQMLGRRVPGKGYRPFDFNAMAGKELCQGLKQLHAGGQKVASIVGHSFSMLKHKADRWQKAKPDNVVRRRFELLARFLAENKDTFNVATASDLTARPETLAELIESPEVWPRSTWPLLLRRYAEQVVSRL